MKRISIASQGEEIGLGLLDEGTGKPVVLIHGFASNARVNWEATGWISALVRAGFRAVAFDNRGHGESAKFHEPERYSLDLMAQDAWNLIEAMKLERPHVMGYSMGAKIAARLAIRKGNALGRIILSGVGWSLIEGSKDSEAIKRALLSDSAGEDSAEMDSSKDDSAEADSSEEDSSGADSPARDSPREDSSGADSVEVDSPGTASDESLADSEAGAFRDFAERTGSDLAALAACCSALKEPIPEGELRGVRNRVLVAAGTLDERAASADRLASLFPGGRFFPVENRDHMRATGDKSHISAVLDFLRE